MVKESANLPGMKIIMGKNTNKAIINRMAEPIPKAIATWKRCIMLRPQVHSGGSGGAWGERPLRYRDTEPSSPDPSLESSAVSGSRWSPLLAAGVPPPKMPRNPLLLPCPSPIVPSSVTSLLNSPRSAKDASEP